MRSAVERDFTLQGQELDPRRQLAKAGGDDRRTGELLRVARTDDVIDAHVALALEDGDRLLTSDPEDLERLARARNVAAVIVRV